MHLELQKGEFMLSTDPARLDVAVICDFLLQSYWAKNRTREIIEKALRHSLCFGVYHAKKQVGFGRAVTDRATFGYLADVFILEPYRGRGLGRWLVESILAHRELKGLRRWCLATRDAHPLYRPLGFSNLEHPDQFMERVRPYPGETTDLQTPAPPPNHQS